MATVTTDPQTRPAAARTPLAERGLGRLRHAGNWVFLVPALVFFVGYQLYPILRVLYLSFTDFRLLTQEPARWIGLQNYAELLSDPIMWRGLGRAVAFTVMFLPGAILLPLLLAILVDRVKRPRLATFYRVVLLIPAVVPSTLIFVLWTWIFNFQIGPINHLLVNVLEVLTPQSAPQWLSGTFLTLLAIVIMETWWGLGFHTIFYLAGLAGIPSEMNEAARIDGASEWNLLRYITIPRLLPIMSILVVLRFGTAMAVIDEFIIFGGFNRGSATYTWTMYMYDTSFKLGNLAQGRAAAIGWIGAILMMIVVAGLLYVFRPRDA
ncbi:MAG TPA: sugar ABC transporter permease [Egibacteraceae bacterium]|nr:sugar ABC transporter permease [Egibacteraceae bacterium]